MTTQLSPSPVLRVYDNSGELAVSGSIYTYAAGTSTPIETYTDYTGTTPHTNPITLNSRGECQLWLAPNQSYKMVAYDSDDNLLWSSDYVSTPGASPIVSVTSFGAVGDGVTDDGPAFRLAIESLGDAGGEVYAPKPPVSYLLKAEAGNTSNTAVEISDYVTVTFAAQSLANVIPGANNTVLFRVTGKNGGLNNVYADNRDTAFINCSALRLAPMDESSTTTRSDIEFNNISNFTCRGFSESTTLKPGPTTGDGDSYLYYNTFTNVDLRNNTRGLWLKSPSTTSTSNGPNRNRFFALRVGETGTNTGIQIDNGNTNTFVGCSIEGVESGSSPSAIPTGLIIGPSTVSANTDTNYFTDLTIEGCTKDVTDSNPTTIYNGWFHTGSATFPNGGPAVDIRYDQSAFTHLKASTDFVVNKPTAAYRVDIGMSGNGDRFNVEDQGSAANQIVSFNIAKGGGPSGYIEFLYGGSGVLTFGGASSAYTSNLKLMNPLNGTLTLGQGNTDRVQLDTSGNFIPAADNSISCGKSGRRFTDVWATNGTIQTSDQTLKDDIGDIDQAVLRAWSKVNFCQFKWKEEKNDDKQRIHFGVIAQKIVAAFESEGLDPFDYGIVWKEKDGPYSVSYSEALALECAYLRNQIVKH
jgi:hypothetical protein